MSKTETSKTDRSRGIGVHRHLVDRGLETPMKELEMSDEDKLKDLENLTRNMMDTMSLDLTDDSLVETPKRVAKMWVNELFWGLNYDNFPKATVVENKMKYDEMVLERDVTVHSMCEHHLLPILGNAYVAYIPKEKVLGLSKLNRIVEFFSRRPQIQERLTAQIFETLTFLLETQDVAVCIAAEHLCVKIRGVEDSCSDTVTSKLGGTFKVNPSARAEFYQLINIGK